jgi:hypothetical protein
MSTESVRNRGTDVGEMSDRLLAAAAEKAVGWERWKTGAALGASRMEDLLMLNGIMVDRGCSLSEYDLQRVREAIQN